MTTSIRYSARRMLTGPAVGMVMAMVFAVLAAATGALYGVVLAVVTAALSAGWAVMVRRKLSRSPVALARDGELLVGGELPEPLAVAGATFAIVAEREGGWVVRLEAGGRRVTMQARVWALPDGSRPTKAAVAEALQALGVSRT